MCDIVEKQLKCAGIHRFPVEKQLKCAGIHRFPVAKQLKCAGIHRFPVVQSEREREVATVVIP